MKMFQPIKLKIKIFKIHIFFVKLIFLQKDNFFINRQIFIGRFIKSLSFF